ncbi:hypothetical protein F5Y15DRAFT_426692 [Xylariaceae sp. FL0016]|nr:hypothetical protein F5Y15DRAFT_426692 [Xylariaceae sp. FL0016]
MFSKFLALAGLLAGTIATPITANHSIVIPPAVKHSCGTHHTGEALEMASILAAEEASGTMGFIETAARPSIDIDVYMHVVQSKHNNVEKNLNWQMAVMNHAYEPHNIHFSLRGVTWTINETWAQGGDDMAMKSALRRNNYATLNLYYIESFGSKDGDDGLIGLCTYPTTVLSPGEDAVIRDGCTIKAETLPGGGAAHYDLGKTTVHEIGHWLGLLHVFEGYSCEGDGDYIDDTPPQSEVTWDCPVRKRSCPELEGAWDSIHNYMDYSNGQCPTEFTPGQEVRMFTAWSKFRHSFAVAEPVHGI